MPNNNIEQVFIIKVADKTYVRKITPSEIANLVQCLDNVLTSVFNFHEN